MVLTVKQNNPKQWEEIKRFITQLPTPVFSSITAVSYESDDCAHIAADVPIGGYDWRDISISAVANLTCYSINGDAPCHGAPCCCDQCIPESRLVVVYGGKLQ
jgi:hypothetical protein